MKSLSNHLDCRVEHALGHFFVAALESDEERCAALDVETERDILLWRPDRGDAKDDKHQHERGGDQPFPQTLIGGEIPSEKDEHREPDNKCNPRGHSDFNDLPIRLSSTIDHQLSTMSFL